MKKLILILCFQTIFFANKQVFAQNLSTNELNLIANAIKKVEGNSNYGIISLKLKGNTKEEKEIYARKICINTIKNNFARWKNQSQEKDYISFLGSRFAPLGVGNDPKNLNKNWIKNMKFFLGIKFLKELNAKK